MSDDEGASWEPNGINPPPRPGDYEVKLSDGSITTATWKGASWALTTDTPWGAFIAANNGDHRRVRRWRPIL